MLRLRPVIGVVLALAFALVLPAAAAATPLLFVQQTDGGTLTKTGGSAYRLTLRGVAPSVAAFADRPGRTATSERASTFVSRWRGRFGTDPPNAALVIDGAPRGRDVAMLTLSAPRYRPRARTLTYTARALRGDSGAALKAFHARRDPVRALRFGAASLFIDDTSDLVYQQVTLTVSNAQPGQQISVQIVGGGSEIAFSTGSPLTNTTGMQLISQTGSVPLSSLTVAPAQVAVVTSPSGGGASSLSFALTGFLVAQPDLEVFYLRSVSDPGVLVTVTMGNGPAQLIGPIAAMYLWPDWPKS